jgi:hypothetical protein
MRRVAPVPRRRRPPLHLTQQAVEPGFVRAAHDRQHTSARPFAERRADIGDHAQVARFPARRVELAVVLRRLIPQRGAEVALNRNTQDIGAVDVAVQRKHVAALFPERGGRVWGSVKDASMDRCRPEISRRRRFALSRAVPYRLPHLFPEGRGGCPLLQRPSHGGGRRPPHRPRPAPTARPPVGALRAQADPPFLPRDPALAGAVLRILLRAIRPRSAAPAPAPGPTPSWGPSPSCTASAPPSTPTSRHYRATRPDPPCHSNARPAAAPLAPCTARRRPVPAAAQASLQKARDLAIVLDDQDPHALVLFMSPA